MTRDPSTLTTRLFAALSLIALAGCAGDEADGGDDGGCSGGKCDAPTDPAKFACKNVVDESERGRANVLAELNDPFSELVLRGGTGCPKDFAETIAKLRVEDKTGCETGKGAGMSARFVTETGQFDMGALRESFRVVTTRRCNSRQEFEVLFSTFGVTTNKIPGAFEAIGFDKATKEFNYYELTNGQWHFFGSSGDFIQGNGGRCKGCHTGGGLVMKELDTPWMHWTGHHQTDGTTAILDANKDDLGSENSGANMESLVNAGNREWTKTRVTHNLNPERSTVAKLLEPLFCSVEVNVDNAVDFEGTALSGIPVDFLVDPQFKSFGSVGMSDAVYTAARDAAGSKIEGLTGKKDTFFKFAFVERSKADNMYIEELKTRGIIDDEFVKDVLAVDFTRPIFSDARCALLDFAPTFDDLNAPVDPTGSEESTGGEESTGDDTTTDGGSATDATTTGVDPTAGGDAGNCCTAETGRKGCENDTIEMCVCGMDDFCCMTEWDETCVGIATGSCSVVCGAGVVEDSDLGLAAEGDVQLAVDPAGIRAAFIARLKAASPAAGTPAADLLANLQAEGNAAAHKTKVDAFLKACEDRDERAFMDDVMKIFTWQRGIAFSMQVFEFPQTLMATNLSVPKTAHFDAATCEVVN